MVCAAGPGRDEPRPQPAWVQAEGGFWQGQDWRCCEPSQGMPLTPVITSPFHVPPTAAISKPLLLILKILADPREAGVPPGTQETCVAEKEVVAAGAGGGKSSWEQAELFISQTGSGRFIQDSWREGGEHGGP